MHLDYFFFIFQFSFFFKKSFIYFWERGEGRERNTNVWLPLRWPRWEPGPQPRHVPWLGIQPATLWFTGWHSIQRATPARVQRQNVRSSKRKTVTYKWAPIKLSTDSSTETFRVRIMAWNIQSDKNKNLPWSLVYTTRLSFKIKGEIKSFWDKKKAKRIHYHHTTSREIY